MTSFPTKRIVKISLISAGGFLAAVLLAAGIALSVVLSPQRLTPLVNRIASDNLQAEVQIRKVDVTFFSTFPHMGLELKDGIVVSHTLRDSAFQAEDTLCAFHRCVVGLNLRAYTRHKKLSFFTVALDSADCRLFMGADGRSNYQIFGIQDTFSDESTPIRLPSVEVKRFRIGHVDVRFQEQRSGMELRIGNLAVAGEGECDTAGIQASVDFEVSDIQLTQNHQRIIKGIPLQGKIQTAYNYRERKGSVLNSGIRVKQLELGVQGDFFMDTTGVCVDMNVDLQTVSLQELLDMVPPKYLQTQGVRADGQMNMHGHLYGCLGEGKTPEMDLRLNLENGRAHYEGMPYPIDTLLLRLDAHLAPNQKAPSYIHIENLSLVAKDVDVVAACRVNHLFSDPSVDFKFSTKVDLATVPEIFPLRDGLAMGGVVDADMDGKFRLSYIRNANYGKIQARGKYDMDEVFFNDTLSGLYWNADAQCRFKGGKYLGGVVLLNKLHGKMPSFRAYVDSLEVKAITQRITERSEDSIVSMACAVRYARLYAALGDSLRMFSRASTVKGKVVPEPGNPRKPLVTLDFQTDSLFIRRGDYRARLTKAVIHARMTRNTPTSWWPTIDANLQRMAVTMPQLSEPLQIRRFKGALDGKDLEIEKARFRLGESRLTISGKIWDLQGIVHRQGRIRADLQVKSRMIDCNQLLNILMQPVDTAQLEAKAGVGLTDRSADNDEAGDDYVADSLRQITLFMVPDNLDLRVDVNANKVYYDRTVFDSIHGKIRVRNKAVNLREFHMQAWGADMTMNLVYASRNHQRADIGADVSFDGIRVDSLVRSFSVLDSTLPMLRSFEGNVDLQATASAQLDSSVNILLPSLTAAMHLHGDSLVLLDGETFTRISKALMFKNKKRNLIDSVSVVVAVQDGKITIYPFVIEIDKYKVAVGGWQDMDMNYRYHISLLEAPVLKGLTRGGITMNGNFNDEKLPRPKLGHPLYKDAATPAFVRQIDESRLELGKQIMLQFEGWMNRERRRLHEVNFPKMEISVDSAG
ncbi:hypothetical protein HDR62_03500 [bacterium]|nr:hypothetical protein [bacterium]